MRNIDLTIKPKSKWGPIKSPKVMVRDCQICRGLVNAGLCTFPPKEEVTETEDGPLLNGLFGVTKDEYVGDEVFRLMMNVIPANSISEPLSGDVATVQPTDLFWLAVRMSVVSST